MKIEQLPGRFTRIVFGDGIIATWRQPYYHCFLPWFVKQMIYDSSAGDPLAMVERDFMRNRCKLTVK